jgi:hypothetical protein
MCSGSGRRLQPHVLQLLVRDVSITDLSEALIDSPVSLRDGMLDAVVGDDVS